MVALKSTCETFPNENMLSYFRLLLLLILVKIDYLKYENYILGKRLFVDVIFGTRDTDFGEGT